MTSDLPLTIYREACYAELRRDFQLFTDRLKVVTRYRFGDREDVFPLSLLSHNYSSGSSMYGFNRWIAGATVIGGIVLSQIAPAFGALWVVLPLMLTVVAGVAFRRTRLYFVSFSNLQLTPIISLFASTRDRDEFQRFVDRMKEQIVVVQSSKEAP